MTRPVRLAGSLRRPDGTTVTWTLAEGRKGRRWRETVSGGRGHTWALLYETDGKGAFTHLELAAPAGLATLHPEGDATLHGNVVAADRGVQHVIGHPYPEGGTVLVAGSLVAGAAVARTHRVGAIAVVLDPVTLELVQRVLLADDLVPIDDQGAPLVADAAVWPLEAS